MYSTGTAAAFTADSFVVDTDTYLFESIQASSFSLVDKHSTYVVSDASASNDSVPSISLFDGSPVLTVSPGGTLLGTFDSGLYEGQPYTSQVSSLSFSNFSLNGAGNFACRANYTVPTKSNVTWDSFLFPTSFELSYNVSALNSSSLEFSGVFAPFVFLANNTKHTTAISSAYNLKIFINGSLQKEYRSASRELDLGGWIYNGSSTVSNVKFELNFDTSNISVSAGDNLQYSFALHNLTTAVISGLLDDGVLDGLNDNAQDAMNQQEAIESQWTGSMTENFNNLSLSDFSFPVAAVNGFSLISGIFNDLWNAMGDFRIAYVFPLTLGVVLLLIGRLSRTSVKRSSGRGDDDA